jgi:hypothetical protein
MSDAATRTALERALPHLECYLAEREPATFDMGTTADLEQTIALVHSALHAPPATDGVREALAVLRRSLNNGTSPSIVLAAIALVPALDRFLAAIGGRDE